MLPEEKPSSRHHIGINARIGINAHLLSGEAGYRRAGIHQYIEQLLRHLPKGANRQHTIFTQYEADWLVGEGITAVSTKWNTQRRLIRIGWEQIVWPWQARRRNLDLLHSMAFVAPLLSNRPTIITVYDLSFIHFPENFPAAQRVYLTHMTRLSCRRAVRVITISESSRQDVHRFFDIPLERIDVIRPGVDAVYRPASAEAVTAFREAEGINGRFILHVGTLQPRKNIPVLLDAFAKLADPALKLVLVGGKGWLFDSIFKKVTELGLQDQVHFTGYVPDDSLPLWYSAADLFVFPSVYEGFGMPVLEAMACGTPVIASSSSSIPEAVGAAGLLFDPQNSTECAERMQNVLNNSTLSGKMRQLGLNYAKQFSWERAGKETAVVYQKALQLVSDESSP